MRGNFLENLGKHTGTEFTKIRKSLRMSGGNYLPVYLICLFTAKGRLRHPFGISSA